MSGATKDPIGSWVDEAAGAMGGDVESRRDARRELTSTIYDKVEERTGSGEPEVEAIDAVLAEMGDPRAMGHAFLPQAPLIAPERTRAYLLATAALFAVHGVLVIGATVASMPLRIPPFAIRPLEDASFSGFGLRALEILFFDAGLVLAAFMLRSKAGRLRLLPRVSERAGTDPRRHASTAAFLALVLVVVNFFRDNLLALYVPQGETTLQVPLLGTGFTDNLLWFNAWLLLAGVREVWYALRGATRASRVLDVATRALGIFTLLRLVATRKIVDLSAATEALGTDAETVGSLLNSAFSLIALAAAALLAFAVVQRD